MFAKLINENLKIYKPPIKADGKDIYTNDKSVLLQYGWKEVVNTETEEREGFYPSAYYEETETEIIQKWEYIPIPEEPTLDDTLNALNILGVD